MKKKIKSKSTNRKTKINKKAIEKFQSSVTDKIVSETTDLVKLIHTKKQQVQDLFCNMFILQNPDVVNLNEIELHFQIVKEPGRDRDVLLHEKMWLEKKKKPRNVSAKR